MSIKKFFISFFAVFVLLIIPVFANTDSSLVLNSDTSLNDILNCYSTDLYIVGGNESVVLYLPSKVNLKHNLKIDNVILKGKSTIFANGNNLYIGENVTSESRLTVYGGADGETVDNTNIELHGGIYERIYGGCNNAAVNGDTNIVFVGNCNIGDGIDDTDETTLSPCYIYGGGNNGSVNGNTNIYFGGNAVSLYVFGAGYGENGTAKETNIVISGGKIMNVYGGSQNTVLTSDTSVTLSGGLVESVFGGSLCNNLTGNTTVKLIGGEVSRRVYTGCYNDGDFPLRTKYYVNGNTFLFIGKDVLLNSENGLSTVNKKNIGVFAGSRLTGSGNNNEINTIIFLDGCYSTHKKYIVENTGNSFSFGSNEKYTVKCSAGGKVEAEAPGYLKCTPNLGKYLEVNNIIRDSNYIKYNESSITEINFKNNFLIESTQINQNGIVTVTGCCNNVYNRYSPILFICVYDSRNKALSIKSANITDRTFNFEFDTGIKVVDGMSVKAFLLDNRIVPLCSSYVLSVD